MLTIALLIIVLAVVARQGRWRYFETRRLPDGNKVNAGKYVWIAIGAGLLSFLLKSSPLTTVIIVVGIYAQGPYLEFEFRRMFQEGQGKQTENDVQEGTPCRQSQASTQEEVKSASSRDLWRSWWQSRGMPSDPPDTLAETSDENAGDT